MNIFSGTVKKIAIIAISGIPDKTKLEKGTAWLESAGIKVEVKKSVHERCDSDYLASDLKTRVDDIHSCWEDESLDAVVAARGGFGSAHLLPCLDWKLLGRRNMPFIGYSDLTAIHLGMYAKGVGYPVSAPMIGKFPEIEQDHYTLDYFRKIFDPDCREIQIVPASARKKIVSIREGKAEGPLVPVTLSVLATLIGTEYLPDLSGCILLIEDINEPIYKLDRYLTQLVQSGVLGKISGLLCGNFARCGREKDRMKLLSRFSGMIDGPVAANIPFGHLYPRISVPFGIRCNIDGTMIVMIKGSGVS